jgi:hypothetical protein
MEIAFIIFLEKGRAGVLLLGFKQVSCSSSDGGTTTPVKDNPNNGTREA